MHTCVLTKLHVLYLVLRIVFGAAWNEKRKKLAAITELDRGHPNAIENDFFEQNKLGLFSQKKPQNEAPAVLFLYLLEGSDFRRSTNVMGIYQVVFFAWKDHLGHLDHVVWKNVADLGVQNVH